MQQTMLAQINKDNTFKFYTLMVNHIYRNIFAYMLLIAVYYLFAANYKIAINNDVSLPGTFFIIHYGEKPDINDMVAFKQNAKYVPPNHKLVKILSGKPGDSIVVKERDVYLNGTYVGHAKPLTRKGNPLTPVTETKVPPGKFYVVGTHKDSYDSRYEEFGFLDASAIEGTVYAIF
ncbi:MAG: signal peptidase I [Methylophilus sp.]|uniref:signal peptidase I n=1 Tax=Methylophilus sp. TaxID=29541 RepID=UPI003F9F4EFC